MPLINKKIKKSDVKRIYEGKQDNLNNKAVYNTNTWRKLRLYYLQNNPLCKRCEEEGKIVSAVEVHHIVEIDRGNTIMDKKTLGYDYNNLEGLCKDCHKKHHYNKRRNIDIK